MKIFSDKDTWIVPIRNKTVLKLNKNNNLSNFM